MIRNAVHSVTSDRVPVLIAAAEGESEGVGFGPATRKVNLFRELADNERASLRNKAAVQKLLGQEAWDRALAVASMKAALERRDERAVNSALIVLKKALGVKASHDERGSTETAPAKTAGRSGSAEAQERAEAHKRANRRTAPMTEAEHAFALAKARGLLKSDEEASRRTDAYVSSISGGLSNSDLLRTKLPITFGESWDLHEMLLAQVIGEIMSPARLVYWFNAKRNRMETGIYCPDLRTAVLVELVIGDSFRICPQCRTTFWGEGDQVCCSFKCREAHRVARHRARQKTKKGGR